MISVYAGVIPLVIIGVIVALKTKNDLYGLFTAIGGFIVLLAALLLSHSGSLSEPNYSYVSTTYDDNKRVEVFFDEFSQNGDYVLIDDYSYRHLWTWLMEGYIEGETPILIKVPKDTSFVYKVNQDSRIVDNSRQQIVDNDGLINE